MHTYSTGAVAILEATFGAGNGLIFMNEVGCTGNEASILECSHVGNCDHECSHFEDAGVMCLGKPYLLLLIYC